MTKEQVLEQAFTPHNLHFIEVSIEDYEEGIRDFNVDDYDIRQDGFEYIIFRVSTDEIIVVVIEQS